MAQFIYVSKDIHYEIMSYLGHQEVKKIYPNDIPMVSNFIKKDFISHSCKECENFAKHLYIRNNNIIELCKDLHQLLNFFEEDLFYETLERILNENPILVDLDSEITDEEEDEEEDEDLLNRIS